jgi:cyclase
MSDRRQFLSELLGGVAGLSFPYRAFGQTAAPPITATKLSDTLVVLSGDGGNVALVIGEDGLMMVDGGFPERAGDMQKAVALVDSHKVSLVFNTHWHFDHTGSNETLGRMGTKIMAHENVKKRVSVQMTVEALNRTFEPLKPEGRPTQEFPKGGKMTFGKEKIEYMHIPTAHTDSDSYVFFPGPNVLHTGDMWFSGVLPVIDYSSGGWVGGMAHAAEAMLKVGDAKTRVVPGHGPVGSKDDLKASHEVLVTLTQRLEKLHKEGKTVEDAVAANPTKEYADKWGHGTLKPDVWTKVAYTSIIRRSTKA